MKIQEQQVKYQLKDRDARVKKVGFRTLARVRCKKMAFRASKRVFKKVAFRALARMVHHARKGEEMGRAVRRGRVLWRG